MLVMTDILKGGSQVLVSSEEVEKIGKTFDVEFKNNRAYIEGLISRKKQVTPPLTKMFDN